VAVVSNVEPDHLDHYGSFQALREAFDRFCAGRGDRLVIGGDDPVARELGERHGGVLVGLSAGCTYRIDGLETGPDGVDFDLVHRGAVAARLSLPVPGVHNARNAALAAVVAASVGAPFDAAHRALARFAGVARRFEFRGEARGVTFVDDYAHLPTEVAAALAAAAGGSRRVVAVFQPHRYTRTAALWQQFADAFTSADAAVVTEVYPAGEAPMPGITGRLIADAVRRAHPQLDLVFVPGRDELRAHLGRVLRPGDLCITLGAGDLTTLPDELLQAPTW
jgi:UDP-N-acetylmuramate--alanine ligase